MTYIREDQADIRVSIDGIPFGAGSWATYAGGDVTATDAKTRPGGMGREVSVGGPASRGDITVTIQWTDDLMPFYKFLESKVGNGHMKISVNWLGPDRNPINNGFFTRTGTLKSVSDPNYDHNGSAVGMMTAVMSCDEIGA